MLKCTHLLFLDSASDFSLKKSLNEDHEDDDIDTIPKQDSTILNKGR